MSRSKDRSVELTTDTSTFVERDFAALTGLPQSALASHANADTLPYLPAAHSPIQSFPSQDHRAPSPARERLPLCTQRSDACKAAGSRPRLHARALRHRSLKTSDLEICPN